LTKRALKVENRLIKRWHTSLRANPNTGGKLDGQSSRN
jgi:hypothetical protein